jgi:hypothetical protein
MAIGMIIEEQFAAQRRRRQSSGRVEYSDA